MGVPLVYQFLTPDPSSRFEESEVQTIQYGMLHTIDYDGLHVVLSSHSTAVECCSQSVSKEILAFEHRRWGMRVL